AADNNALVLARLLEAKGEDNSPAISEMGLLGAEAIREAFEGDLRQLSDLLTGAIKKALELAGDDDWWPYIRGLFNDYIVVENKDGKLLSYPYATTGTKVTLGTPTEVVQEFKKAGDDLGTMTEAVSEQSAFIESTEGGNFRIRVIQAGLSGNNNYYPDSVLREAVSLFEGARVLVKSDKEHLSGQGKSFENLIGGLQNVSFVEGAGTDTGEIQADLAMIEPNGEVAVKLREAIAQNLTSLFGFSIDALSLIKPRHDSGRVLREARKFTEIRSVDLIVEPGAGGTLLNLIEAKGDPIMDREQMMRLLEAKGHNKADLEKLDDKQLIGRMTEAIEADTPQPETPPVNTDGFVTRDELRMVEARADARVTIQGSNLPEVAQTRLIDRFTNEDSFTPQVVQEAIQSERDYLANFAGGGTVNGLGDGSDGNGHQVFSGETQDERNAAMLEACLDISHQDHAQARSFRECYVGITGDRQVTGQLSNCHSGSFREALNTTTFSLALGNSMNRRMLKDYKSNSKEDAWRRIADVGELNDFREQKRSRFGGYGDLSVVGEGQPYPALVSPDDEEAKYSPNKRGGTEEVTLEMIKNDDVNIIRRIPGRMSRAAKRTLSKFVFDFIIGNGAVYDNKALFHVDHNNLSTIALTKDSFEAARLKMVNQTEPGSNQKLFFNPKTMLIGAELGRTAYDLFKRDTNNDADFIQTLKPEIIEVWCWDDANDWALIADPMDVPTIEIGFLDGKQEPEMFVQDNPSVGSVFTNDKIKYKLRHIYGGAVMDYRGFQKAVVA
ncbi:hypothetical protein, partial [uncultured Kiloniella sp.]|uniref:phage major capsid protein n=1 Tax=uncultured Kiloniella sp. TaxID=1133091 RepID=UPI0026194CBC